MNMSETDADLNWRRDTHTSESATPVVHDDESDTEQPEFELRNRDDDIWEDITTDNRRADDDFSDDSDTMDDVYHDGAY